MMCSANVGGDPVNGCENEVVPGEDLCRGHLNMVEWLDAQGT